MLPKQWDQTSAKADKLREKHCSLIVLFLWFNIPSPDPPAEFPEVMCLIGAEHPRKVELNAVLAAQPCTILV